MHRRILSCFAAAFGWLVVNLPASAGTLFVDANPATGANDGSSWVDAFQGLVGLQSALAVAVAEIGLAGEMYKPTATLDRTIAARSATSATQAWSLSRCLWRTP